MIRRFMLAGAIVFGATATASAFSGRVPTVEKVVAAGRTLKVGSMISVDPTCRSLGPMAISVIDAPHDGRIAVEQGRDFPSFSTLNTRSHCNTRKVPATIVFYTPAPGYAGEDDFTIEHVGLLGNVGRTHVHVSVR